MRNATLQDLSALLQDQHARKVDMVVPASKIRARDGYLQVEGAEQVIDENGVTTTDGTYLPTIVCDEGIAAKLQIPIGYVRRMRVERPDLWDQNVNGWLHGRKTKMRYPTASNPGMPEEIAPAIPGDDRKFLLRTFRADDTGIGVARAFLSDSYKMIDNLDVLVSVLDGVREADVEVKVEKCDLSDRRMYVRVHAPQILTHAPGLLARYRNPFTDQGLNARRGHTITPVDSSPIVFAGFVFENSEVGNGAFSIKPQIIVEVCTNGMTVTKDVLRSVHLGGKMDEGVVAWSDDTQQKNLALVKAKTRDAVKTFLDVEYVQRVVDSIEEKAAKPLDNSTEKIRTLGKRLQYSEETTQGILDMFIRGGDVTAGGVMHAVTAYAQITSDADLAHDLEDDAFRVLDLAASL